SNTTSRTHLAIDDSADNNDHPDVTMSDGEGFGIVGGLANGAIIYVTKDVNAVDVKSGAGIDTFDVFGTPSANPTNPVTTLNPGGGANFIPVRGVGSTGPLNIVDGPFDVVTIGDSGSVQDILSSVTLSGPNDATSLTVDDSADPNGHPNVTIA